MIIDTSRPYINAIEQRKIDYSKYVEEKTVNNETEVYSFETWRFVSTYPCGRKMVYELDGAFLTEEVKLLQKKVSIIIQNYFDGEVGREELKNSINGVYEKLVEINKNEHLTSGENEEDNLRILGSVISKFQLSQAAYNSNCNFKEGEALASGDDRGQWEYYNAKYYYRKKEFSDVLQGIGQELTEENELGDICNELMKCTFFNLKNDVTLEGSTMHSYESEPPRGFVYFQYSRASIFTISGVSFTETDFNTAKKNGELVPDDYKRFLLNFKYILPQFMEQLILTIDDDRPDLYTLGQVKNAYDSHLNYSYF